MRKVIGSAAIVMLTSCGMVYTPSPLDRGHFVMAGDERGVRAFMSGQNGLVQNGKEKPSDNSYWAGERQHERNETARSYAPTWLQGLFGKGQAQPSEVSNDSKN